MGNQIGGRAQYKEVLKLTEDSRQRRYQPRDCARWRQRTKRYADGLKEHSEGLDARIEANDCPRGQLADYTLVGILGGGGFGAVLQVALIGRPEYTYALKVQKKNQIETDPETLEFNERGIERAILEKHLLWVLGSPFVLKAVQAFQDLRHVYLVSPKAIYGDLRVLTQETQLDEQTEKYIIVQLVAGIEYLHAMGIVHRDLKPGNILLFEGFYIKIADLGLARRLAGENGRAFSFNGTPEYQAPEVRRHEGYGMAVDWYGLGFISFELVYKVHPFVRPHEERVRDILSALSNRDPVAPGYMDLRTPKNRFISSLLMDNPSHRLGGHGAEAVKNHGWFTDINFFDVLDRIVHFEGTPQPYEPGPDSASGYDYLYDIPSVPEGSNNRFAEF